MPELPSEVSILILGGLVHVGRALVCFLINGDQDGSWTGPAIKHIRLVDKYLVAGKASTTHVDPITLAAFEDPRVEYKQVNLTLPQNVSKAYNNPNGGSYDIVFDFTGEGVLPIATPEELHIDRTVKLAHSLAVESQRRGVLAHVRDTICFMTVSPDAEPAKESDVPKPKSVRAYWWYEAERAAACVPGLNLAILRSAQILGPHQYTSAATGRVIIGKCYHYGREQMKWLWGPELRCHTLWSTDYCRAACQVALWMAACGRAAGDEQAGEKLPPVKMKDKVQDTLREKVGEGCCPCDQTPFAPVFNVADDADMTQGKLIKIIGDFYGIETGFVNAAINTWARLNLASVVDEINEKHVGLAGEAFSQMSREDLYDSHINVFQDAEALANRAVALDTSKIKRVLGWQPKVTITSDHLYQLTEAWKSINNWVDNVFKD